MQPRINKYTLYFWGKVRITNNADECWIWTGAVSKNGYGCLKVLRSTVSAHRHSLEMQSRIRLTAKDVVRHKCDNKLCVNPNHLEIGTHKDNTADMIQRGRSRFSHGERKGEQNGNSTLTNEDVAEIRNLLIKGMDNKEIAAIKGVSHSMISRIKLSKNWSHI